MYMRELFGFLLPVSLSLRLEGKEQLLKDSLSKKISHFTSAQIRPGTG